MLNPADFCSGHPATLTVPHFTYPGGMEARVGLVRSGIELGPPAHKSEHCVGAANVSTN